MNSGLFVGLSTRDIAERAGVHHPLITYHFKNKDQLWRAAADQVFTEFGAVLAQALSESGDFCAKTRFTSMMRAFVRRPFEAILREGLYCRIEQFLLGDERALLLSSRWSVGVSSDLVRHNLSPRLFSSPRLAG